MKKVIGYLWVDPYEVLKSDDVQRIIEIKWVIDELIDPMPITERNPKWLSLIELHFENRKRWASLPPITKEDLDAFEEIKNLQSRYANKLTSLIH